MRNILMIASLLLTGWCGAQPFLGLSPVRQRYSRLMMPMPMAQMDSSGHQVFKSKWHLQPYSSLAAGMMFWKGGGASYIAAPMGLQLSRSLSNNVFAFAGVNVAPSVFSFRQPFATTGFKNTGMQGMYQPYQLGVYSQAELGLGYTNDARTFTITGSIGIQRNDYPFAPAIHPPVSSSQQRFIH